MIKQARWVVIADAGRARVFELDAKGALVRTPIRDMEAETAPSRELGSDRPGRTFDGRHAEEPPTDPHRYEKRRFADELAGFLEDARKQDLVGQLFIVAPPQMLGDLAGRVLRGVEEVRQGRASQRLFDVAPTPTRAASQRDSRPILTAEIGAGRGLSGGMASKASLATISMPSQCYRAVLLAAARLHGCRTPDRSWAVD